METLFLVGTEQDFTGSPCRKVIIPREQFGKLLERLEVIIGDLDVQIRRIDHDVL